MTDLTAKYLAKLTDLSNFALSPLEAGSDNDSYEGTFFDRETSFMFLTWSYDKADEAILASLLCEVLDSMPCDYTLTKQVDGWFAETSYKDGNKDAIGHGETMALALIEVLLNTFRGNFLND